MRCYSNYQELTIFVKVPVGLTLQSAVLVLDADEARAISWLMANVGLPKIIKITDDDGGGEQVEWVWDYAGDELYREGCLYFDFEFDIFERSNWRIDP